MVRYGLVDGSKKTVARAGILYIMAFLLRVGLMVETVSLIEVAGAIGYGS